MAGTRLAWLRRLLSSLTPAAPAPGRLAIGQRWTFADAPNPRARVIICDIEARGNVRLVSVAITDVDIGDPETGEVFQRDIFHAPFLEEALDACLLAPDGSSEPPPGFGPALAQWREDLAAGDAGVFDQPVAGVVALYGRTLTA